jgi:hypothetical protein
VIIAFPEAFENTKWEKEPCDHFKNKADYAEMKHGEWIKADLLLQKLHNLRNDWSNNNIYVDGFKSAISSIEGIVEELTNCGSLMDGRGEQK